MDEGNATAEVNKSGNNPQQEKLGIDDDLLIQAFTHLFPCLTKSLVVEDYLDHLLAKHVIDIDSMKVIQSKATSKDKSRELLSQVCQQKGACQIMFDLFLHEDINKPDLYAKVLSEYRILSKRSSKEKVMDTLETFSMMQIKEETLTSHGAMKVEQSSAKRAALGKYLEIRVGIVNLPDGQPPSTGMPSAKEIFSHFKKQPRLKEDLQCFMHDFDREGGNWICFASLKMPYVDATNDFEWEELSPLLTGLSSGDWHGFIEQISIKPFVSEGHKKDIFDKLSVQNECGTKSALSGRGKKKSVKSQSPACLTTNGLEIREDNETAANNVTESQVSFEGKSSGALAKSVSQCDSDGKTWTTPAVPQDLLAILRQVRFGVGKASRKRASEVMNCVARSVVDDLKEEHRLVLKPEFSGSSFEGAKIEAANEFDMLIILDGKDLDRVEYNPQFFYLRPRKDDNPKFKLYLSSSGNIDPEKMTSVMFSWVQLALNKLFPVGSEYIVKVKRTGPAVTLYIESNPKSPTYQRDLGKIDVDLVATFKVLDEQFVAKPYQLPNPEDIKGNNTNTRDLWRKSFSLLEKQRLNKIDNDGGCRRQCLRLFKFIRVREPTFKRLASYHYKILLLNECDRFQEREDWVADKLAERLWGLLASLKVCLEEGNLPHCIDDRINIFEKMKPIVLSNMTGRVKKMLNKGSTELKNIFDKKPIP